MMRVYHLCPFLDRMCELFVRVSVCVLSHVSRYRL